MLPVQAWFRITGGCPWIWRSRPARVRRARSSATGRDSPWLWVSARPPLPGTADFEAAVLAGGPVLTQDRYLTSHIPYALEIHASGAEPGRPRVIYVKPLKEGYVEAFGVDPQRRRRGRTVLQQDASQQCRIACLCHADRKPHKSGTEEESGHGERA